MARCDLRPIFRDAARAWVYTHHGHNDPPEGWLFGTSAWLGDEMVGVGMAGRPVGPGLDTGRDVEVTRVCLIEGAPKNAASRIYGALCRAAQSLGFRRAYTYTLAEEAATCVRAAGFVADANLPARASKRKGRYVSDLFGTPTRPEGAKVRWIRHLAREAVRTDG